MNLKLFIQKPILAAVICLLIVLLGISAYTKLPVREFPLLPAYQVTISTTYPGASPDVMEGFISMPMQQVLSGLEGLDYISSSNTEGNSLITLNFFLGTDIAAVLPEITNRISSLQWQFPSGVTTPVITKVDPNSAASGAIMYIDGESNTLNKEQVTEYLQHNIVPKFEAIPGVSQVQLFGGRQYAMRIWLDPAKMAARGVTASDVTAALLSHNLRSTSGTLNGYYQKLDVTTTTNLSTPAEFNDIVIKAAGNHYVRIKDIGEAVLGATNYDDSAYANGKPTVMMAVMTTDKANAIDVADRVTASLHDIQQVTPPGLKINLIWDVSQFSRESIHEVHVTIIQAAIFVFIVIFVFLGSFRSITVPLVTIPLSILGAAAIMFALGYSLNTLTLLAWVLAIGLVVDDSIVVVENIHRHMELGQSRFEAAIKGVYELRFAIITMTLCVAIVFTPIGFVPGISGALFKQFAFTLSLVVLVSGVLALLVSPVMCTRLLPSHISEKSLTHKLDHVFNKIRDAYKKLLITILEMPWLIVCVFIALVLGGSQLMREMPSELMPTENTGVLIGMGLGPSNTNLDYLEKYADAFNNIYAAIPDKLAYGLFNGNPLVGATNAISWILLKPSKDINEDESKWLGVITEQMQKIPGLLSFSLKQPTEPGAMPGQPVSFVLKTTDDYNDLALQIQNLILAASKYPGITNPNTTFRMDKVQVNVTIDRDKAAALGVSVSDIAATLGVMMGQPIVNFFGTGGYSYQVIPQLYRQYQLNPNDIKNLYVRANNGALVSLANVVTINESVAPQSLDQFQQMNSATLQAGIAPGYTMGQVLDYLESYVKNNMPHNYSYDFIGDSRQFIESGNALLIAFAFALVLIYLLLTAHFNSFRDPFIVMLSVPLAVAGALFAMYMTDATLNIYTKIGLIMLVGLISKHGILMIDFAKDLQEEGVERKQAMIQAASIRLRPILMTTASMIFGALPLVLAHGAGSIARAQIGWVIIGGMSLGTCLTLFVVPMAYSFFGSKVKQHINA